uniref:Non-specific lipid-transfer protein 2 n=1 Tax=Rhizophora mucronata TaxID=61149 RepID=A0A2P2JBJ2_RHIMU
MRNYINKTKKVQPVDLANNTSHQQIQRLGNSKSVSNHLSDTEINLSLHIPQ